MTVKMISGVLLFSGVVGRMLANWHICAQVSFLRMFWCVVLDNDDGGPFVCEDLVDSETKATWKWILTIIRDDLGIGRGKEWAFVSDQEEGLMFARHIYVI
ncbi:unnamed protein product [Cuscuta europaea]|uniref:MULE transposase domain-containing protein n=1 Tax=Cuscuta europaea TaxID=41803 RepID=A0A9P0YMY4_CUSEU|nr:unnamed protein product [Cuscuta europaea]